MRNRVLIFALFACLIPAAVAGTVLSLEGPALPVAAGSLFSVNVRVADAVDLAAYQFDIGYDPLLLSGVAVDEGPLLPSAGPTLFIAGLIDDPTGTISFIAGALTGLGPGVTGDGLLAILRFRALAEGVASLSLLSPLVYDSIPNPIDVTTSGTRVGIEAAAIPEPQTMYFVVAGLGLLAWRARRTRR